MYSTLHADNLMDVQEDLLARVGVVVRARTPRSLCAQRATHYEPRA